MRTMAISEEHLLTPAPGAPGASFHDHELLSEIARGGMGVVYRARQISLDRLVALKMILSGHLAGEAEIKRFHKEAEAVASLDHPNIVTLYQVGEHEGQHYFTMRLVEGPSLARKVETGGWKLDDVREAARLLSKVAHAIHYAHQQGILHRDLKPANILLDPQGEPHVTDFGIARQTRKDSSLTAEGAVLGTPSFMAPEQAAGKTKELSPAADIYSLGAILYYLLTGRPPFVAETPLDTLVQVLEGEVVLPRAVNAKVPPDLQEICIRCLDKSPEHRYASAAALADDLDRFLRDEPVAIRRAGLLPSLLQWSRRQPSLVAHLGAVLACALIAQVHFMTNPTAPLAVHLQVMGLLAAWATVSAAWQKAMNHPLWTDWMRFVWASTDVVLLTSVLAIIQAVGGPLMTLYPTLVACSGLWFRVSVVGFTTVAALLGHGFLLWLNWRQQVPTEQLNWHLIAAGTNVITGLAVACLTYRVKALSRFYDHRVLP